MTGGALATLALRALRRRPGRTALTLLGQVVAVLSMTLFLSVGEGLRGQFRREVQSVGPDLQVARPTPALLLLPSPNLPEAVARDLAARQQELGVAQVTPVVTQIRQSLDPTQSAVYYGLPADQGIGALFPLARAAQGRLLRPADEGQAVAVLGASAARQLGTGVGGTVQINRRAHVRVIGVLAPVQSLTDTFTFLPLTSAQRALGTGPMISSVALRLQDPARAPRVAGLLRPQLHLEVSTRSEVLRAAGQVVRSADAVSLALSLVALVVGGLGVANTLLMTVHERQREFAVMRAVGARPGVVTRLVLLESALLAGTGWLVGAALSVPGVWAINRFTAHLTGLSGAALTPRLLTLSLAFSVLLGLLAGWWPARQAGRIRITRALGQP